MWIVAEDARQLPSLEAKLEGRADQPARAFPRATPPLLALPAGARVTAEEAKAWPGVAEVVTDGREPPLAGRLLNASGHVVRVGQDASALEIGGPSLAVIAGPCSVEPGGVVSRIGHAVVAAGAHGLRGGAFKPRTSPYAFQGMGAEGLEELRRAREATGLPFFTEVMAPEDVPVVAEAADALQVGARNMQNFALLRALGEAGKPVLLKRGFGCTVDELLWAAEYILAAGNPDVILCERGIRTFGQHARFTFDLAAVAVLKERSRLPVLADPSHAAGRPGLVGPLALGALAAGADGLIVECHDDAANAWSDGQQALTPVALNDLVHQVRTLGLALGRTGSERRAGDTHLSPSLPTDPADAARPARVAGGPA